MTNKVLKTISLKWTWQGDTFMLKGFNIALMKNDATPTNGLDNMISYTTLDKNCYNPNTNKFEYSFYNLAMDAGVKCTPWIQALFENDDSEWVNLNGTVIADDGNATIVVIGNPTFQQVIDMSKDNKITPQEKEQLKKEWDEITSDHFSIYAGITKANLSNEDQDVKAYISAANELAKYFNNNKIYYWHQSNDPQYVYPEMIVDGLTTDLNTGHYISVATYREKIRLYYETKVKILNLIQDTILANNNQLIQDEIDKNTLPSTIAIGGYTSCDFTKNSPAIGCIKIGMGSFNTTTGHKFNIKSDHNITTSLTSNKFRTRFILFVGADFSRFNVTTSANNNSNMFVTAMHKKGKWYYFDGANETLKEFTPMAEDCVVAKIEEYNTTQTANNGIQSIKFYASTSQSIFDSLTDGGKLQGVFKDEGGRLFINAEFIQANSITADKMNIKGIKVVNVDTGETTFEVTSKGLVNISANRFVLTAGSDTNVPTKDEVKNDIDNIQIGVRNIFKDGGLSVTNSSYLIQNYFTHVPLATGKTYTIVFKGSISEGQQFGLWYNGGSSSIGRWERKPGSAVYTMTFTLTAALGKDYLSIYNYPSATGKTATIEWACLYEGNVKPPLDFVQAPEDNKIGGRNLVINSAPKTNVGWSWAGAAGTATLVDEATAPRGKAMKATFTAEGSSGGMHKPPKERLKVGSIYSWACWIKASKEMTINLGHEQDGSKEFIVGTEWQRITHTFKASDRSYNSFVMYARNPKIGDFYLVHSIQVEAGNIIGDWSAAPEDYDAEIAEAQQNADNANNKINEMSNDNKLTSIEKQSAKLEWDVIAVEKPKIEAEAVKFGIDKTDYVAKYNVLANYLSPLFANLSVTSDIVGDTFRTNFKNYYDARQTLLNAISSKAKDLADNANNKIDGLQIGVRNYILNSNMKNGFENYAIHGYNGGTIELVDFQGKKCLKFTDVGCWDVSRYLRTPTFTFPENENITFSMDVYITKGSKFQIDCSGILDKADFSIDIPALNKWIRINGTSTSKSTSSGESSIAIYAVRGTTISGYITCLKAETGLKATDWTAAPEDTQSDIDNKVDVGGTIDDINQSPNGQIDYPKLNIRGAISFDDLDSEMGKNFIAKKDSQGNRIQTVINGGAIETSSVTADKMSMYNLNVIRRELVNGVWQERDTSFAITDEGKIRASGTFSSFNYKDDIDISKSEGWMINENGDSVFNNSVVRGRVELPNAGITDYGGGTIYNLLQDSDFRTYIIKTDVGWDNALNGTKYLPYWGGYNSGVTDPSHGYHARVDTTTFPFNTILFRNKNSEIGQKNRWMGVNGYIYPNILKPDVKYTFAVDIYFTAVGQKVYGGLYHVLTDNNNSAFNSGQYTFISTSEHVNKWTRFTWTFTTNAKLKPATSSNWYIYGYGGTEGDVFVNRAKLEEGEVATPYASTAEVAKKEVRIYAGTDYHNRYNAPLRILQDGSIIATKGEFNGTVTGRLEIGNISIYDDLTTPGVIEIKNNDNSKSVVKIGEEYSEFNSDVYLGSKSNYLFRTNISGKQLISGKQSSIRFEYEDTVGGDKLSSSLTISGRKIQFNENEYIYSTNSGVIELGTDSTKGILNIRSSHNSDSDGVLGEMQVNIVGSASISNVLKLGNVDLMPVYPSGLDIFVN